MATQSSKTKPNEQLIEKEPREELEYLRAENAIQKKLKALTQASKEKALIVAPPPAKVTPESN